jgi:hypothetical protein
LRSSTVVVVTVIAEAVDRWDFSTAADAVLANNSAILDPLGFVCKFQVSIIGQAAADSGASRTLNNPVTTIATAVSVNYRINR